MTTEQPGSLFLTPSVPLGDTYTVKATLLRPRNAVGILVDAPDGANGMFLYFRPEDRDIVWYQLRDGNLVGPVAAAPYNSFNKTAVSGAQDVVRELLGGYPAALLIVAVMLVLGRGLAVDPGGLTSRGLTPDPSPSEVERGEGRENAGSALTRTLSQREREAEEGTTPTVGTDPSPTSILPLSTSGEEGAREGEAMPRKVGLNGHRPESATVTVALANGKPVQSS